MVFFFPRLISPSPLPSSVKSFYLGFLPPPTAPAILSAAILVQDLALAGYSTKCPRGQREAVRSCVLARRWRFLWKSMPVLLLIGCRPVKESLEFMNHLLILRDRSPLDAFVLDVRAVSESDERYVNLWLRYALACNVRVLTFASRKRLSLPAVSNLTRLELSHTILHDTFLNFLGYPSLEELKITNCSIYAHEIISHTLKRLSILECWFTYFGVRTRISAPSLTSLQLTHFGGRTPLLEDMPALATAAIVFGSDCVDSRGNYGPTRCGDRSCQCCYSQLHTVSEYCYDASCECCYGTDDAREGCVLLNGLSAATDLKLVAGPKLIILERDLRRCPTFSKLKTLFVNEWTVDGDHRALIHILQHTPVLENLTLQLYKDEFSRPVKATYNSLEQSFASANLKIVEVACEKVDERVHNIMKSLSTYGIPLEKINIRQTNKSSGCFNFVCTGFSSKEGWEDNDDDGSLSS